MRRQLSLPFMRQCIANIVTLAVVTAFYSPAIANDNNKSDYRFWQQTQISGIVADSKGNPVPGITVTVKGTNATTLSKSNGSFSINAKQGDILVFSGISFTTKEVKVGSETSYNVSLTESVTTL